jgi:hypothetical protein
VSCVRLAWLDCRALEHFCAVDHMVCMHCEHDGDKRRHCACQWNCVPDYGVRIEGCSG